MPRPLNANYRLYNRDCLEVIEDMKPKSIDTVITDPPYGLSFMGKEWDHGVPGMLFWARIKKVCKPGALLLAFGGTRTYHRLACAIEDAGWEIRDCMMWLYGSGFPKSHDLSKAADNYAGAEREVVGKTESIQFREQGRQTNYTVHSKDSGYGTSKSFGHGADVTAPTTDEAKQWQGYGTALKPAWEPIIVAMKPFRGSFVENALFYSVGGLNVDGGRIASGGEHCRGIVKGRKVDLPGASRSDKAAGRYAPGSEFVATDSPLGRWPANVILLHHPECVQVGTKKVKGQNPKYKRDPKKAKNAKTKFRIAPPANVGIGYADADGLEEVEAWRCHEECPVKLLDEQSKGASRFFYTAKASKKERNEGLEGLKKKYLATMGDGIGEREHNPEEFGAWVQNNHPTVKPLALMKYLCLLTRTPEGGTVFDPFMGSGTTGVACAKTQRKFVGCEIDQEHGYYAIARQRISKAYASTKKRNKPPRKVR